MMGPQGQAPGIRPSAGDGSGDGPPQAISPELALVDPVAAAAARASLPDQPWEIVVERARRELRRRPVPAAQSELPAEAPVASGGEAGVAPERPPSRRPRRDASRRLGVAAARRLALMAAWAVLITGLTLLTEVHSPNSPALGSGPEPEAPLPRLQRAPAAGAGYVIGPGSGFRVGPHRRAIAAFTLPVPCIASVQLPRIPVGVDKTFSFRGTVGRGDKRVRVWLAGRFAGARSAVGAVTVRGATCPRRQVSFVARLRGAGAVEPATCTSRQGACPGPSGASRGS